MKLYTWYLRKSGNIYFYPLIMIEPFIYGVVYNPQLAYEKKYFVALTGVKEYLSGLKNKGIILDSPPMPTKDNWYNIIEKIFTFKDW